MEGDSRNPKISLLRKYDMPVEHLSYEYVQNCSNKKELERIVRILRSGEEGFYPDLLKVSEERLRLFAPESRVLRVETPILTKDCLTEEERTTMENELLSWENEMKIMDKSLDFEKSRIDTVGNKNMPEVRKVVPTKPKVEKSKTVTEIKNVRIKSGDYEAWEKFDVDKELLKMDVEEERRLEENEKKKRESKKQEKKNKIEIVDVDKENYSSMEQQVLASQAKDRGNECYKSGDLESALKYYEISLRLYPTVNAYNNRAMTYLKLKQYESAIKDCNKVLQMEKTNIKALHRRATAYQNLPADKESNNYDHLALQDLYKIIYLEPNNKVAQADLQKLMKKLNIEDSGKKFRMLISEESSDKKENQTQFEKKKCSAIDNISTERLPLTYYGPSTSTFKCEPYSMMHRALSGSSIPGEVLCKCNSNRPRQNPLCRKCGEAMCTPKPKKTIKAINSVNSVAKGSTEAKNQLLPKETNKLSNEEKKSSIISNELPNEVNDKLNKKANSNSGSEVTKDQLLEKEADSIGLTNNNNSDKNNNRNTNDTKELEKTNSNVKEILKEETNPTEKVLPRDKIISLPDKKISSEDTIQNNNLESEPTPRKSDSESAGEVTSAHSKSNDEKVTENNSSQSNSKKSKHKKKKSKEHKEKKNSRKHVEPLIMEPIKVVHAAKYLHPTSVEPKITTKTNVESQQETTISNNLQYKVFVPNRKCYSSEYNRVGSPAAATQSKKILREEINNYSAIEGNKENISDSHINAGNEKKEDGGEEIKSGVMDSAFEFMKTWEELKKFDESYAKRAEIIRKIRPSDLSKVIGIKLDSEMLSCLLECLLRHVVETDPKRVVELLNELPHVPRYGLVCMFLAETDKKKLKKLIETAEGKGFALDENVKKNLTVSS